MRPGSRAEAEKTAGHRADKSSQSNRNSGLHNTACTDKPEQAEHHGREPWEHDHSRNPRWCRLEILDQISHHDCDRGFGGSGQPLRIESRSHEDVPRDRNRYPHQQTHYARRERGLTSLTVHCAIPTFAQLRTRPQLVIRRVCPVFGRNSRILLRANAPLRDYAAGSSVRHRHFRIGLGADTHPAPQHDHQHHRHQHDTTDDPQTGLGVAGSVE